MNTLDYCRTVFSKFMALCLSLWLVFECSVCGDQSGVCAKVRLVLSQDAVMTGSAFRATLELFNDDGGVQLTRIGVQPVIQDTASNYANDRFSAASPQLNGLNAVDGTGTLAPASSGSAVWTFVPSQDAAPTGPTVYRFGGTLTYSNDAGFIAIPLEPVTVTVQPNAALYIRYFHQRDVLSDDPFTEVVEPAQPYYLAVQVENRGAGTARNLSLSSPQPTIVDNEKGLLINFQVVGASVDGRALSPSLSANFGDVAPGQRSVALWSLTSTLQGLFTEYKATMEYQNGLGGKEFSSFKDVEIHELIRLVRAPGALDDGKPDFLVNDIPDPPLDLPDTLYLSDGSTSAVQVVTSGTVIGTLTSSSLVVTQTAVMPGGWAYLRVPDPGANQFRLRRVVRSDGVEIYFGTNVWTTDRTFIGMGKAPIYENILHLLDYNSPGSYTLFYALPPPIDTNPPTSSVAALPAESYPSFPVSWSGADEPGGSGLAFFDVYASDNSAPFTPWLQRTTLRNAMFQATLGHTYAFYSRATDAAGNTEPVPGTPQATTLVSKTNSPPVFGPLSPQVINEGQTLVFDLPMTDPNGDPLNFTLVSAPPPGLSLDATSGRITWPTTEANGPSTNVLAVLAQDNGIPPMSTTGLVTVVVNEVNSAPVLAAITNRTINEGFLLLVTNQVTDFDLPPNQITFSLGANSPIGAAINATNGIFRWRPTETQGPGTNLITVTATDNGVPPLSATQQFIVIVRDTLADFTLAIGSTNLFLGESNAVPLSLGTGVELASVQFMLEADATRLAGLQWVNFAPEVEGALLVSNAPNRWRYQFSVKPGQTLQGVMTLAQLRFVAQSNAHSAIVPLQLLAADGLRPDGTTLPNPGTFGGRLFLVGPEPLLDIGRGPILTLYGHPGTACGLQYRTNLSTGSLWTDFSRFTLSGRFQRLTNAPAAGNIMFYRAYEIPPFSLGIHSAGGQVLTLTLTGQAGAQYWLQTATGLSVATPWMDLFPLLLTNPTQSVLWTNLGEAERIFRVRQE
jgi:hypothetical protein